MKDVKPWPKASFIKVLFLAAALVFKAAGVPLSAQAQTKTKTEVCQIIWEGFAHTEIPATAIQVQQAFHFIQTHDLEKYFNHAGDRVLLRLAKSPSDPILNRLTWEGFRQLIQLTVQQKDLSGVIKGITGKSYSETEIAKILTEADTNPLERMLKLQGNQKWDEMIQAFKSATPAAQKYPHVRIQAALAYNRRNLGNDRAVAERMINTVIKNADKLHDGELLAEAYGILARIYKDRSANRTPYYTDYWVQKAIKTYRDGFKADPLNFYPGSAALELLWSLPGPEAAKKAEALLPSVIFALNHSMANHPTQWTYTTNLKILVVHRKWSEAFDAIQGVIASSNPMALESTVGGYTRIAKRWETDPVYTSEDRANLQQVIVKLQGGKSELEEAVTKLPSLAATNRKFPNTEGALALKPVVLLDEMDRAQILQDSPKITARITQESVHKFLQNHRIETNKNPGYLLGITGPYKKAVGTLSRRSGHMAWWDAYERLRIPRKVEYTEEFLNTIAGKDHPIILLIPEKFRSLHYDTTTWKEYQWILQNRDKIKGGVEFVYGAYDLLGLDFYKRVSEGQANGYDELHMMEVIRNLQDYLQDIGKTVQW